MAWRCPDIERESLWPMTAQLIAYGSSSDDPLRRSPSYARSAATTQSVSLLKGEERVPQGKSARRQDDRAIDAGECATAGNSVFHLQTRPDGPVAARLVRHVRPSRIRP